MPWRPYKPRSRTLTFAALQVSSVKNEELKEAKNTALKSARGSLSPTSPDSTEGSRSEPRQSREHPPRHLCLQPRPPRRHPAMRLYPPFNVLGTAADYTVLEWTPRPTPPRDAAIKERCSRHSTPPRNAALVIRLHQGTTPSRNAAPVSRHRQEGGFIVKVDCLGA
jgi:hypothetical protein